MLPVREDSGPRYRCALYTGLTRIIGDDQAVEEMLSYFPARDVEEPVTKEFLRAEMADLRAEMHTQLGAVRTEVADLRAEVHVELAAVRADMHAGFRRLTVSMFGMMVGFSGVVVAAISATG